MTKLEKLKAYAYTADAALDADAYAALDAYQAELRKTQENTMTQDTAPQMPTLPPFNRIDVLLTASNLINGDREAEYGTPQDNFANIAQRWSQTVGVTIKPWQVAIMMADLKIARMATTGKPHQDSFVDIAGYAAIGSEISELS
jgi:hypothetical protein